MRFSRSVENLIADFKGLPRTAKGEAHFREPTELKHLLEVLNERYKFQQDSPERVLVENWNRIFGEKYAQRCSPLRIVNQNTLIVAINHPVLRSNLMMESRTYLARIQELPLCDSITRIVPRAC